jgi:hypothetical protein
MLCLSRARPQPRRTCSNARSYRLLSPYQSHRPRTLAPRPYTGKRHPLTVSDGIVPGFISVPQNRTCWPYGGSLDGTIRESNSTAKNWQHLTNQPTSDSSKMDYFATGDSPRSDYADRLGLMTNRDYDRPRGLWRGRLRALGWIIYFVALIILLFLLWPMTF